MQKHTVEFNQLAMANSEGSEVMLNRVMTKDNIGVAVLLELRREMIEQSGLCLIPCCPFHPGHFACLLLANVTELLKHCFVMYFTDTGLVLCSREALA